MYLLLGGVLEAFHACATCSTVLAKHHQNLCDIVTLGLNIQAKDVGKHCFSLVPYIFPISGYFFCLLLLLLFIIKMTVNMAQAIPFYLFSIYPNVFERRILKDGIEHNT